MPRRFGIATLITQIREDWRTHQRDWTLPGFRALMVYRYGHWATNRTTGVLRSLLTWTHRVAYRYVRNHYGIELPASAIVGRRLLLGHQSGIVIHPHAEIGDDCMIRQNVTIGSATPDRVFQEAPKLGNRVQIGVGAVIVGKVRIGDDARIGPTAVVLSDVAAGASVFVPPPRTIQLSKARGDGLAISPEPRPAEPVGTNPQPD